MQRIDICFNVPKKDQTLIGPELVKIYIIEDDLNPKSNILKLAFYTNYDFIIDTKSVKYNDEVTVPNLHDITKFICNDLAHEYQYHYDEYIKNVPEYYKKLANIISEACGHNYIIDKTFGKSYYDIVDPKPDYAKFTVYNRDDCLYTALFIKVDRDTNISTRIELSVDKEWGVHIKSVDKSNIVKFISRYTYQLFKIDDLRYAPNKANRAERIINHINIHADLTVKRFDIIDASKDSIIANSNQTDGQ